MIAHNLHRLSLLRFIVLVAMTMSSAVVPNAAISAISKPVHVITIQENDGLALAPKEDKAWYEQGIWPVAGATLALFITNGITVCVVYLQSSRSFNALLRQRKIERHAASLNDFYNPLLVSCPANSFT